MKIAICSDLHLEFAPIEIKADADVLILSGDIFVAEHFYKQSGRGFEAAKRYRAFLEQVSSDFQNVIYVAGNHEFYDGRWNKTLDNLYDITSEYNNIHFLERNAVTIQDVTFLGATLWTDMNKSDPITLHAMRDMMNDYRVITDDSNGYSKLTPLRTVQRHRDTLAYFRQCLAEQHSRKFVVVSHHAPSKLSTHPMYKNEHISNGAYSSDLSEFILDHPQIKLWTHGHTHEPFDYSLGSTRIVCNPRGYKDYEIQADYFQVKVVEV